MALFCICMQQALVQACGLLYVGVMEAVREACCYVGDYALGITYHLGVYRVISFATDIRVPQGTCCSLYGYVVHSMAPSTSRKFANL